ncbi:SDR family NAD(P)-dependent oxidoreductase [Arthrobacter woluwensis]|uniref:SDR family NAD(P)-dependent oxidoreductase n=1 Tax=Arthrobacter woluwensis TaxID=156980 RepID=UPI001AAE1A05|nr:SDR family NAD(P)-dependent oxidoreductase [Arthrobacter woluwensis]QTF71588.1 SDR family NAD(P)-dependent oxidoreductase [Arthrobacter woluwensis]
MTTPELTPDEIEACLKVLNTIHVYDEEDPDYIAVRRATGKMFKAVKRHRRNEKRDAIAEADRSVMALTATAAPDRIDDETRGNKLKSSVTGEIAGHLIRSRPCYICKQHYTQVDAFYHQLCPDCAAMSHAKRDARTDLTGRRALLTGGRAKIGMYIALRLLRDGAHTTITTRFPKDAARRFAAMEDSAEWLHRLRIVGIDLRDPSQVMALTDSVAAAGPLDIIINNAAQTVRRSGNAYQPLVEAEDEPLPAALQECNGGPELVTFGHAHDKHPLALASSVLEHPVLAGDAITSLALSTGSASLDRIAAGTAIDAGGLVPDLATINSWTQVVDQVDPLEMLEVQLCNVTAPFLLVSRLRDAMRRSTARRKYVVNVSAMEGQFSRAYKGPGHPHTNMAKASLNMMTRTSAGEMFETDQILMTAVDTGWITDERPHYTKVRLMDEGFHAPLDLVDGAARVYDPIVMGEAGEDQYGVFLKDYKPSPW